MAQPDLTSPDDALKAGELARMRLIATGLLGAMAVLFVAASLGMHRWPWLAYVRAFGEAGMVGACADWFAVTALFRRPFGLPIPHTGIVPRSKQRIGEALGAFIADNFLTVAVLEERLRQLELASWGGSWLRRPANAKLLASRITALIPQLLALSPPEARRDLLAAAARGLSKAAPAGPLASKVLQALWNGGRAQPLLDWGLDVGARALAEHEPLVRAQVKGRTPRWMPKWVNKRISNKVVAALIDLAAEMRAPDHPWRIELKRAVEEFIVRLDTDPALAARVDELKLALISDPLVLGHLDRLRQDLEASLGSLDGRRAKAFSASMARAFVAFGEWLDTDKEAGAIINSWARAAATQVVAPQRKQIGVFIAQVVAGWDTRSVVDKLELQVGKDLQYIRVNGTLVGGLVGLVIFTVARLIGLE